MLGEVFSAALARATERTLPVMELLSIAGQLGVAGQQAQAAALYQIWLQHNTDSHLLHAIYFNYGVVLTAMNDLEGAKNALAEAIRISPDFMPPYINIGSVLDRMGATGDAVTHWYAVANKLPQVTGDNINYKTSALKQIGRVLERANYDVHAEDALRQGLELNPTQTDVIQHWVSLRQRQCKWPVMKPWANVERAKLVAGISALSLGAYSDDPLMQLGNAFLFGKNSIGQPPVSFVETHARHLKESNTGRRKVGYLSSDLREHAIGFLTSEIYELHDRATTEVFLYYCGIKVADKVQERIKGAAEHWCDISEMTDEEAAKQIVGDGIEILVDVNGFTNSARTKLLAMRPAPVIVNWLGFPGSMATPYHNYIVADDFIIPKENELFYSEKVLRLPCYQPNDRKRVISPVGLTRQAAGLPEDAVVYCCFNGVHKITPFTWKRWIRILQEVPNSVLWLLEGVATTNQRLQDMAKEAGVAPERIIFAPKMRNPDHLARYPLADLFLDTSPYGAHTTSSDAMWMGVPVLTLVGRCFASRVCGSLVTSAGLADLVCETPEDYVQLAIKLGLNKDLMRSYREKLQAGRDTCVLFDTPLLVSKLEGLYEEMWQDFRNGTLPRPDLSNLEVYNDIGVELDKDDVELLTVPNYLDLYRQKLAMRSYSTFLNRDPRLWPGQD